MDEEEESTFAADDKVTAFTQSTPKIPPAFDGRSSWFAFEEAVDDWVDITTLSAEKQGPSLKNRLYGDASVYKPLLDRDLLRDANTGVKYFKDTLRPHFVKGVQAVFLLRFYQFLRSYRGQQDLLRWIGRLSVVRKRVQDSWMDLLPVLNMQNQQFIDDLADVNAQQAQAGLPLHDPAVAWLAWEERRKRIHMQLFPTNENLFSLMFKVQADLSE